MADVLAYVAGGLVGLWGISHAIPTRKVVKGFEPITSDNRLVIIQEWLAEAMTMWGLSALIVAVTVIDGGAAVSHAVYRVGAALLLGLAVLTAGTGARTQVAWFKVCPVLLASSAALLIAASLFS